MNRPEGLVLLALTAFISVSAIAPLCAAPVGGAAPQAAAPSATAHAAQEGQELRAGGLDEIILLDKSLSMAPYFEEVKAYVAGTLITPILVPGDRLIVEAVYGKTDRLATMSINSKADIAGAIRAIREVKADGRYTDLGTALDTAKRDLDELGMPERPKYVVLVTDEIQEAPSGSPYQSPDHKLKHPSLQYVKRVDLGKYRAITVGLQVGAKVDATAPQVMNLLLEPPQRGVRSSGKAEGPENALPSWLFIGAGLILVIALAGIIIVLVISRKAKKDEETERQDADDPGRPGGVPKKAR